MNVLPYVLVSLYGSLTAIAGIVSLRNNESKLTSFLFSVTGLGMIAAVFFLQRNILFTYLIISFIVLHILAILMGIIVNGALTYRHHIIRFIVHAFILFLLTL